MRIIVTQKQSGVGVSSLLFFGLLAMSLGFSVYSFNTPMMWFGIVASAIAFFGMAHSVWRHELLLQIDNSGIYDRRLGIGKILWDDVEDVQLQVTEANRFLCFKMRNAEPYLARLKGANRERVMFHRQLGFQGFNVDISPADVNLLDLKRQIDLRVRAKS